MAKFYTLFMTKTAFGRTYPGGSAPKKDYYTSGNTFCTGIGTLRYCVACNTAANCEDHSK